MYDRIDSNLLISSGSMINGFGDEFTYLVGTLILTTLMFIYFYSSNQNVVPSNNQAMVHEFHLASYYILPNFNLFFRSLKRAKGLMVEMEIKLLMTRVLFV